jgi:heme oxygenase
MRAIEMGLTIRQADLIIEALRLKLRDNNDQLDNLVLSGDDEITLRSNNEVIRSTMLSLKDQIHRVSK